MKKKSLKKPIYVDSNIFLYAAIYDPDKIPEARRAKARLQEIAAGSFEASTSTLTWDEITWVVRRFYGPQKAAAQGASFLRLPNVRMLKVDVEVITQAQSLLEKFSLKPRDAIHAATAVTNRIDRILSYDPDFDTLPTLSRMAP